MTKLKLMYLVLPYGMKRFLALFKPDSVVASTATTQNMSFATFD